MLGFCDQDSVVSMAERVKKEGMKLMVDFHYSDHLRIPYFRTFLKNGRNWTTRRFVRKCRNIPGQYYMH